MSANRTTDWLKKKPIAHRGLHDAGNQVPENSLAAFEMAIHQGYAIELDVQVIADGEVIIFHDENLERMCGISKAVDELVLNDLKRYPFTGTSSQIPLLKDVLVLVNGKVPLLIEIKRQTGIIHSNMIILNSLLAYRGEFAIQSFDPFILGWFAKNAPLICRGQLASEFRDIAMNPFTKYLLKKFKMNFISKPHFLAYDVKAMPNKMLERKRRKGRPVLGWVVTDQEQYALIGAFCDNIIFEGFRP